MRGCRQSTVLPPVASAFTGERVGAQAGGARGDGAGLVAGAFLLLAAAQIVAQCPGEPRLSFGPGGALFVGQGGAVGHRAIERNPGRSVKRRSALTVRGAAAASGRSGSTASPARGRRTSCRHGRVRDAGCRRQAPRRAAPPSAAARSGRRSARRRGSAGASICGSTRLPATRHNPRAGWFSPYQDRRQSCITRSGSGTPSLIQSSSATKRRASSLSASCPPKRTNLRSAANGSSRKKRPWIASTGTSPSVRRMAENRRRSPRRRAWRSFSAWKSQGVASNTNAPVSARRRRASANAINPPMQ